MDNETAVIINNEKRSEADLEKYFALKALRDNPAILENVLSFQNLAYVLCGLKPNVDAWEPSNILILTKAAKELKRLGYEVYNNEIKQYIAHIGHSEGWLVLPDDLLFAQDALKDLQMHDSIDDDQAAIQRLKHKAVDKFLNLE